MIDKKRILLKVTGELFLSPDTGVLSAQPVNSLISQIKQLKDYQFGIVMGGGNFFRGSQHGAQLGIRPTAGHQVGMLATMLNGTMLYDLFNQNDVSATILSAIDCPQVGRPIAPRTIEYALNNNQVVLFTGGTGNPYFSTDTTAIVRALQIGAQEVWKGTKVDGVYDKDPRKHPDAQIIKSLTHKQAIDGQLAVMDATAFQLAQENNQSIRVFNIFSPNSLLDVAQNKDIGSLISNI